jgi:soluble lytic murein transglycosylase-like protein
MITLGFRQTSGFAGASAQQAAFSDNIRENILGQFCFKLLMFAGLAAGALYGAGPDSPQRVTSVVRPDLRTGKLVRSLVVSSKAVAEVRVAGAVVTPRVVGAATPVTEPVAPPAGIDEAVRRIAAEHSLPPQLIHSVIKVESNYNPHAVSSKGALGLMQLIPATARRFGVSDVFNPVENIQGGAKYLRYLLDLYNQNYPLALAAYNAGEAAVAHYGGIPPFVETQNYVVLVRRQLELAKKAAAKTIAAPAPPEAVEAKEAGPAHVVEIVQADGSVRYVSR